MRYLLTHWIETRNSDEVPTPSKILSQDGLTVSSHEFGDISPTIIVGNPPFHASGSDQMANRFLRKAIEILAPGGFLGMIMPGAFLKMRRQNCPATRKLFMETCEILEVWEMPEGVVGLTADQPTCVLIAQKRNAIGFTQRPAIFKITYSRKENSIAAERDNNRSTWTYLAHGLPGDNCTSWLKDSTNRILASAIDIVWEKIDLSMSAGNLCVGAIGQGINAIGTGVKFSQTDREGYEPYLQHQERLLPFFLRTEDWRDDTQSRGSFVAPETCYQRKKTNWPLFRGLKVVFRARTNRNAKLQTVAAFDDAGVFPENDFRCLSIGKSLSQMSDWARDLATRFGERELLLWITAILNCPIGQAWIAMGSTPRGLLEQVIEGLPLPRVFDPEIAALVEATKEYERPPSLEAEPPWAMWPDQQSNEHGASFKTIAGQINYLLFRSYGLTEVDFRTVKKYLEGMTDPWVDGSPDAHIPKGPERRITGTVVAINVHAQTVSLDLPRYSRMTCAPIDVLLPKDMPGWALREGIGFTCLAPADLREPDELLTNPWLLRDFRPEPYSYLSDGELDRLVTHASS